MDVVSTLSSHINSLSATCDMLCSPSGLPTTASQLWVRHQALQSLVRKRAEMENLRTRYQYQRGVARQCRALMQTAPSEQIRARLLEAEDYMSTVQHEVAKYEPIADTPRVVRRASFQVIPQEDQTYLLAKQERPSAEWGVAFTFKFEPHDELTIWCLDTSLDGQVAYGLACKLAREMGWLQ